MKRTKPTNTHLCDFCPKHEKVRATWSHYGRYACTGHKDKLKPDIDDRMTEADYQTWYRL